MTDTLACFAAIWCVDFEYWQDDGELPIPACMVASEHRTGETIRLGQDELQHLDGAPFGIGTNALVVAYYASAELNCFHALGWKVPARILDLFAEFRCRTSGLSVPCGSGLLGALSYFGLDGIAVTEKESMRQLAMRGGPYSQNEMADLLDYCESDVRALQKLLPAMLPTLDLPRALFRGRYMAAASAMETTGIPVDVETFNQLRDNWDFVKAGLVAEVDADYGVYVPTNRKSINPESTFGRAVMEAAAANELNPDTLAETADYVHRQHRESSEAFYSAKVEARKKTGLTSKRINRLVDGYLDYTTYPRLDEVARELAAEHPSLGIGTGYQSNEGYDATDYAGNLWQVLLDDQDKVKPKHHPDIIAEAVELLARSGESVDFRPLSFSAAKFAEYLLENSMPWPRLDSGILDLSDDTFREMARRYPQIATLRELRHALSQMRLSALAVGSDGRNRCILSAFRSKTGRNQPSNAKFLFGPSCWLRSLIQPATGMAVAYVDWSQQEFGIGAALSGDDAMMAAYTSGDPYLTFAKQAGAVPAEATKQSHPNEREQFKICALAVQYGMEQRSLALRLGRSEAHARHLLELHRRTYPKFWQWSQAAVDRAMLTGNLHTVFGWQVHVGPQSNPRSLANFPCQANGAEMLRLACCLLTEAGIRVCAPVHDAVLIEAEAEQIAEVADRTQALMAEASRVVLSGFELRSDVSMVRYPERYADPRGKVMWEAVMSRLASVESLAAVPF